MSKKLNTNTISITKPRTIEEVRKFLSYSRTIADPDLVLEEADKELRKESKRQQAYSLDCTMFKAMTLVEFESGSLLTMAIPKHFATFGIDMMRQLQKEYDCNTFSEKSTAELATVSYVRTLAIQARINSYLCGDSFTDIGVKFLAVMSKELDRAHRHYLTAIQTLRSIKQPPMQVRINTDTAIIGQNQVVQAHHD